MRQKPKLETLNSRITRCKRCPRLITHCKTVAKEKVARYRDEPYWGKPVPNFLPPDPEKARLLIVGLAPGAHGANRTGRMFTGDRSGDFLYAQMHRAGLCNQPQSIKTGDGLTLFGTIVTGAGHCAPPGNRPTPDELNACAGYLDQTFDALPDLSAVIVLGQIAHRAVLGVYRRRGVINSLTRHRFAHAAVFTFDNAPALLCCYHPSQQNTFTGRLTPDMLLDVLINARELARAGS
jgi:uracil-DNA glycosylase family 4